MYLRADIGNVAPTFGAAFGAQLLDVYVHNPAATTTSTNAAFSTRNYRIASAGAWSELVETQGFAAPAGPVQAAARSAPRQVVDQAAKTMTIALPRPSSAPPAPAGRSAWC